MITRNDLSLGAVRLLALYLIARGLRGVPAVLTAWGAFGDSELLSELSARLFTAAALPLLFGVAVAVFSRPISRWVLPGAPDGPVETPKVSLVQSVAIGTFGLFLIAADLPDLVGNAVTLETRNEVLNQSNTLLQDSRFLGSLLSVGMGVILCTGATFWSRLITRFRSIGSAE